MSRLSKCDWLPSEISDVALQRFVSLGTLSPKELIGWRATSGEVRPQPAEGEVVVFADHLERGFSLRGSKFFRDALNLYKLHPQDLGPNSISKLCQFQVFCQAYLGIEPTIPLFREFFYLNCKKEWADGPNLELGGVTIQRRHEIGFPAATLPNHPKGWGKPWFYCKNIAPAQESPLSGLKEERLPMDFQLPGALTPEEQAAHTFVLEKLRGLNANGLIGVDLI
ncbi:hypothetical protein ZWY2020_010341 [Hordeum vulgare]|nr:hypothetical protein ZWY2020_010341 [Hordeum vulgare]